MLTKHGPVHLCSEPVGIVEMMIKVVDGAEDGLLQTFTADDHAAETVAAHALNPLRGVLAGLPDRRRTTNPS